MFIQIPLINLRLVDFLRWKFKGDFAFFFLRYFMLKVAFELLLIVKTNYLCDI